MNSAELQEAFSARPENPVRKITLHEDVRLIEKLGGWLAVQHIPTGSLGLDAELGGGWPVGYISEITGPPAVGSTTLALHGITGAQRAFPDQVAILYDNMGSFSPYYASACGVDLDRLVLSALPRKITEEPASLAVIDPLLGYCGNPRGETTLVVTQFRTHITGPGWSNSESARTGTVESDVRVQLQVSHPVSGGIMARALVIHDTFHPVKHEPVYFKIRYGRGIDTKDELLSLAVKYEVVYKQYGNRYFYSTGRSSLCLGHGWKAAVTTLHLKHIYDAVEMDVREAAGI